MSFSVFLLALPPPPPDTAQARLRALAAAGRLPVNARWRDVVDLVDPADIDAAGRIWAAFEHHIAMVAGRFEFEVAA